jgi:hypothetical protein
MLKLLKILPILLVLPLSSCLLESKITATLHGNSAVLVNSSATVGPLTPVDAFREIEEIITLPYSDSEGDLADSCVVTNVSNLVITTACSCDNSGVCSVGVTGSVSYTGPVSFDYSVTTNGEASNSAGVSFTLSNLGAATNEEWIKVPADAGGMGLDAFYIMQYESKAWTDAGGLNGIIDAGEVDADGCNEGGCTTANWGLSNLPVSTVDDLPWRRISATNADLRCAALGVGYSLVSNAEWMAIAREVELQSVNWTGDSVGSGCLFRGNSGEGVTGDGNTLGDSCGYNGADPEEGAGRDIRAKLTLSNGAEIYDFAGNSSEWADWDMDTVGFQLGPQTCAGSLTNLPFVACAELNDSEFQTQNGSYSLFEGVGRFYGGTGGAAYRGGSSAYTTIAGAFMLILDSSAADTENFIGFRCVWRRP